MKTAAAWLLWLLGAVLVVLGALVVFAFGTDSTVEAGPHVVKSPGAAVMTQPQVIRFAGPTVEIRVKSAQPGQPVFVGVGNNVDVRNYLRDTVHTVIKQVKVPLNITSFTAKGPRTLSTPPQGLDWWLVSDEGKGSASLSLRLPDAPIDVVIMDPELGSGFSADVSVAVVVKGAFAGALAAVVFGLGLLVFGWVLASGGWRRRGSEASSDVVASPASDPPSDVDAVATDGSDEAAHDDTTKQKT